MRRSWVGVGVMIVLLAAPGALGGCGALRRPGPAYDLSQDVRIRAEVEARLAAEPSLRERQLRAAVRDGAVSLFGLVHGLGELNCAIASAGLVEGVRTVVDQLTLESGPREVACGGSMAPRAPTP